VSDCDRGASIMRRPWPTSGCCAIKINEKLCNPCEGKCVRPKHEAEAVPTDSRSGDDPCWGVGISGALRAGRGVDYSRD